LEFQAYLKIIWKFQALSSSQLQYVKLTIILTGGNRCVLGVFFI